MRVCVCECVVSPHVTGFGATCMEWSLLLPAEPPPNILKLQHSPLDNTSNVQQEVSCHCVCRPLYTKHLIGRKWLGAFGV
jgi:hypothetical protein